MPGDTRAIQFHQPSRVRPDKQGSAKVGEARRGRGQARLGEAWESGRSPYFAGTLDPCLGMKSRRHECRRLAVILGLDCSNVSGFLALTARAHVELDLLALIERLVAASLDIGVVDEYVIALLTRNEAEAPLGVEEFHGSCCQRCSFLLRAAHITASSLASLAGAGDLARFAKVRLHSGGHHPLLSAWDHRLLGSAGLGLRRPCLLSSANTRGYAALLSSKRRSGASFCHPEQADRNPAFRAIGASIRRSGPVLGLACRHFSARNARTAVSAHLILKSSTFATTGVWGCGHCEDGAMTWSRRTISAVMARIAGGGAW
jgi:hypothetical protein